MAEMLSDTTIDELTHSEMMQHGGGTDPITTLIRLLRPGFSEPVVTEPVL